METGLAVTPERHASELGAALTDSLGSLMTAVAAGDRAAFRALYDATSARVLGLALQVLRDRAAAEEALVDVYAQVWRQASRYDPEKGSVLTWIATIARTRAVDVRRCRSRAAGREASVDEVRLEAVRDTGPDPSDASADVERARLVRGALAALPREQRRALEAAFFGGLSHSEIADALGQPLGTVKTRIRSGLAALRRALAPAEGEFA
jgi:RNA polymerase sigma-70 factor (ECF subfamily)